MRNEEDPLLNVIFELAIEARISLTDGLRIGLSKYKRALSKTVGTQSRSCSPGLHVDSMSQPTLSNLALFAPPLGHNQTDKWVKIWTRWS